MTGTLPKINPFSVPKSTARATLCPWQESVHSKYYVDIDNRPEVVNGFTRVMKDLATLQRYGQLVLVTGGEGCGKSATVNWCVHHALTRMKAEKMKPRVVNVIPALAAKRKQLDLDARGRKVTDRLVTELINMGFVRSEHQARFETNWERLDRILPLLPGALKTDQVDSLIILLPESEIADEVIRYGSLLQGRILLMVESSTLDDRVEEIEMQPPPVTLRVGKLQPGDTRRFIDDRLKRSSASGTYPRMSVDDIDKAATQLDTIGQLHGTLHGTYERKRLSGAAYDETCVVSYQDILEYMVAELRRKNRDGRGHS